MISKSLSVEDIRVKADGTIEVRERLVFHEDGVELARADKPHRRILPPAERLEQGGWRDTAVGGDEDEQVRAVAEVIWTPQRIAAFKARQRRS